MNLRAVGKIGFLLVVIGFFMPVACDQNGFELAKVFIEDQVIFGILMYLVFISAIVGIVLGILSLQNKGISKGFEWLCLSVCIASGLIVYLTQLDGGPELQSGAYMILTGWIIAFIFQVIPDSAFNKTAKISNGAVGEPVTEPTNKPIHLRKSLGQEARTNRWGYIFVAPFVVVFCVFNLYPTLYTFILSFSNLEGLRSDFDFVGLKNFIRLVQDKQFWGALANTFIIWGVNFAPQLGIALLLAIWLSDTRLDLAGRGLFRAIVYMPNLLTAVSVAMLFKSLFGWGGHAIAPVNQLLYPLGINANVFIEVDGVLVQQFGPDGQPLKEAINFFRIVPFTRGLVAFIQWWMWYGNTLIILMAGITAIPASLYEAAMIDGANSRQTTWYITLPLLRPIMLFILVTSAIGGMQMFDIPFLLTDGWGTPNRSILTTTMYQYNMAFGRGSNNYAYGAAISIGIFVVTIVLSLLFFFFLQDRSDLKKQKGGNA